ncbi:MAG: dephospho-CoA kinase, partial [Flavobacteriaceae bacterium]
MAKIIGLTGGIGSGKSTVAKEFSTLEVPCYIADQAAKKLMTQDKFLKQKIIALFGEEAYLEGQLNRTRIGQIVFNAPEKLKALNSLVHPAVAKD